LFSLPGVVMVVEAVNEIGAATAVVVAETV